MTKINHKIFLLLLLISAVFLFGCEDVNLSTKNFSTGKNNQTEKPSINKTNTGSSLSTGKVEEQAQSFHKKFSIQALSQNDFTGKNLELKSKLAENSVYTRYYIEYQSNDLKISGIINVPKGNGPFPILILNHGYINPEVYTVGRGLKREQDYFARNGYVVLHPDYRNHGKSSEVESDEFDLGYTKDVINAVDAIKNSDFEFLNSEKIGMLGHSMGGGISLKLITSKPDLIDALSLYAPVSAEEYDNFQRWVLDEENENSDKLLEKYGTFEENQKFRNNLSPMNFIEKIKLPILLHHGTNDKSVPIKWSNKLYTGLNQAGKQIKYYKYTGGVHEFLGTNRNSFMKRNLEFFDKNLK